MYTSVANVTPSPQGLPLPWCLLYLKRSHRPPSAYGTSVSSNDNTASMSTSTHAGLFIAHRVPHPRGARSNRHGLSDGVDVLSALVRGRAEGGASHVRPSAVRLREREPTNPDGPSMS